MRRVLAGFLSIMLLLIPTAALADEAAPADTGAPQAGEVGPADTADAVAPQADEAALELFRKLNEIKEGRYLGELRLDVDAGGVGFWARVGAEWYAQDDNALLFYRASLFGQPLNVGIAQYQGQTWFSLDDSWMPLNEEDPVLDALEQLAATGALDAVANDLLTKAELTLSEETIEGVTYDVVRVSLDKSALEALMKSILSTVEPAPLEPLGSDSPDPLEEFSVVASYWVVRETQTLHRATVQVSGQAVEPAMTITVAGDLYFYPLEGPIPFPEEITAPAPEAPVQEPAPQQAGTLPQVADLIAAFRQGGFKASGEIYASVEGETTWGGAQLDAELYTRGDARVARTQGSLLGTPVQSGAAVRGDAFWALGADGSWRRSEAAQAGARPFDNPAAFLAVVDRAWDLGAATAAELDLFGTPVYLIEVEGGPEAVASLYGAKSVAQPGSSVRVSLLLDKKTSQPIQLMVSLDVVDDQGMIHSLYGTLDIEPWEEAMPFPETP